MRSPWRRAVAVLALSATGCGFFMSRPSATAPPEREPGCSRSLHWAGLLGDVVVGSLAALGVAFIAYQIDDEHGSVEWSAEPGKSATAAGLTAVAGVEFWSATVASFKTDACEEAWARHEAAGVSPVR